MSSHEWFDEIAQAYIRNFYALERSKSLFLEQLKPVLRKARDVIEQTSSKGRVTLTGNWDESDRLRGEQESYFELEREVNGKYSSLRREMKRKDSWRSRIGVGFGLFKDVACIYTFMYFHMGSNSFRDLRLEDPKVLNDALKCVPRTHHAEAAAGVYPWVAEPDAEQFSVEGLREAAACLPAQYLAVDSWIEQGYRKLKASD